MAFVFSDSMVIVSYCNQVLGPYNLKLAAIQVRETENNNGTTEQTRTTEERRDDLLIPVREQSRMINSTSLLLQ